MDLLMLHAKNLMNQGVTPCEYIENTGTTDYIMTDLVPSGLSWSKVEYKYQITRFVGNWVNLFGCRGQVGWTTYTPEFAVWISASNRLREDINSDGHPESISLSVGMIVERTLDIANSGESNFTCTVPMSIFSCNNPGAGMEYTGPSRMYYIRGYDYNNNMIFNLKPYTYNRGLGCIKDTVSGKTYHSKNGTIIGGGLN